MADVNVESEVVSVRNCDYCHEEFIAVKPWQSFCQTRCRNLWWQDARSLAKRVRRGEVTITENK